MPAEALLVAVTVDVFGLAPVVAEEHPEAAVFFEGVFEGVFEDAFDEVFEGVPAVEVAGAEAAFSVAVTFSLPTCGVAGGVWFR